MSIFTKDDLPIQECIVLLHDENNVYTSDSTKVQMMIPINDMDAHISRKRRQRGTLIRLFVYGDLEDLNRRFTGILNAIGPILLQNQRPY